jgi:hypothetical protein
MDATRVKSIFYSLYFAENPRMDKSGYRKFADAFVKYEKRTRTVTDKDGKQTEETYTVAVPLSEVDWFITN